MSQSSTRVAVVTGAGSGVGKASALALLNAGFRVALAGRREHLLRAVAEASGAGERALVVPTDVADPASVKALFDACLKTFGRVDVLFNNAGQNVPGVELDQLTLEQWKQVIDVNVTGMFLCIQQAFRVMKAQVPRGGRIINNGSLSAHTPRPRSMPYTASKHAVTGMTKTAALDGRAFNIAVGQIDIGNASSDMADRMKNGVLQANGSVQVEPLIDPAIVGQSVLYMASLPLEANVLFHTVMATAMPFVGRG
jgi:NAD(P)-dependent dehydrogenase (short-subunit alcohol dehydrogenase family)